MVANRPGGESSRGLIVQEANHLGAKRPGGELSKWRKVHKSSETRLLFAEVCTVVIKLGLLRRYTCVALPKADGRPLLSQETNFLTGRRDTRSQSTSALEVFWLPIK